MTVTKTKEEISIMVDSESEVNRGLLALAAAEKERGVIVDGPFGCLRVRGPMELSEWGSGRRAGAGIPL